MDCFLFKGLSENDVDSAKSRISEICKAKKGDNIYRKGEIGILLSGNGIIKRKSIAGATVTIRSINQGEIFGAASIFGEWNETFSSIIAAENCCVAYLSENVFKSLLMDYPQISINYISFLTDRIRFLNRRIDAFTAGSSEQKLYEYFLSIANSNGKVELETGMAELARRLKIGRSSLYRSIDSLKESNVIEKTENGFILK